MIYPFLSGVIQYILGIAGALKREVATIDFFDCDKFPDTFGVAKNLVQINLGANLSNVHEQGSRTPTRTRTRTSFTNTGADLTAYIGRRLKVLRLLSH